MTNLKIKKAMVALGVVTSLISISGCSSKVEVKQPTTNISIAKEPLGPEKPANMYVQADPSKYYAEIDALLKGVQPMAGNYKWDSKWMLEVLMQKELSNPNNLSDEANYYAALQQLKFLAQADIASDGKVSEFWYTLQPTQEQSDHIKNEVVVEIESAIKEKSAAKTAPRVLELMESNPDMTDKVKNIDYILYYISASFDADALKKMNEYNDKNFYKRTSSLDAPKTRA